MNNQTHETDDVIPLTRSEIFLQLIFIFLFSIVVVLAVCGNSIVIWIVLAHRRMRTATNYFLINLACADILNAVFNIPFNSLFMIRLGPWPFGHLMCIWVQSVSHVSIAANVTTYMAICVDRYFAIVHPLRTKLTHKQTIYIIVLIWILSIGVSFPAIWTFIIRRKENCAISVDQKFEWLFFCFTYVVPIVVLSITYSRIAVELWKQTAIGEVTKRQRDCIQSKRRVVKMLIAIVLIFGICWFPQQLYFVVFSIRGDLVTMDQIRMIYLICYFFAMSNSMYNPFLYCWINNRFRDGFRSVFRFCPCVKRSYRHLAVNRSMRSVSDTTALTVVYSSRRKNQMLIGQKNSRSSS